MSSKAVFVFSNFFRTAIGEIYIGEEFNVYAQIWEDGVTAGAGVGTGVECWIGYNTSDTDPSTWTSWVYS